MEVIIIERSPELPRAEDKALAMAIRAAKQHNCPVTIVVPAKKHASSTPLKYLLSEYEAEALLKGKSVRIADHVVCRLESNATLKTEADNQVLLVINGWSEAIQKIRKLSGICSLVVVSPSAEETKRWREAFDE